MKKEKIMSVSMSDPWKPHFATHRTQKIRCQGPSTRHTGHPQGSCVHASTGQSCFGFTVA